MGAMNKGLNLPAIQRIMQDFEKENAMMDMKESVMSDVVDDVMNDDLEDEEEEGDKILKEVLDEIGVDLSQQVCGRTLFLYSDVVERLLSLLMLRAVLWPHRWPTRNRLWLSGRAKPLLPPIMVE